MARAVGRLLVSLVFLISILAADARPGWCPFAQPTPESEISVPYVAPETPATPEAPLQTLPDDASPPPAPSPPPSSSTGPKRPRAVREQWKPHWFSLVMLGLMALLLLLAPTLWMRVVYRRFDLPPELEPQTGAWSRIRRKQGR